MFNFWRNYWGDKYDKDPLRIAAKAYAEYLIAQAYGWAIVIGTLLLLMFLSDLYMKISSFFSSLFS